MDLIDTSPSSSPSLTIACWNTEWHSSRSGKGASLKRALLDNAPNIVCLPEAHHDFLAFDYHGIVSDPDHGYAVQADRSKVTLWSRWPWLEVDQVGSPNLPPGRFVAGTTVTPQGPVRVVGLCIPWRSAHVSSGRRDREPWEEHERFLRALSGVLAKERDRGPLLVLGDFNQRIPARVVPERLAVMLQAALSGVEVWTAGGVKGLEEQLLCHIAGSVAPAASFSCIGLPRQREGLEVSDHDGVVVRLSWSS